MDFLDPKKQRRHAFLLYAGYLFIGIAVLISTMVLVYSANGFGVNGKGQIVQNGLVFVSTNPNPARIYLNGELEKDQTNARLSIPTGQYEIRLSRDGYRDWTRDISVQGGDVQNYDYPFLFPLQLENTSEVAYETAPGIATQSRDRRWMAVQRADTATFDVYDLNEDKLVGVEVEIPADVVSEAPGQQSWEAIQWANDNKHFLLKHVSGDTTEFLLVNREDATQSVNLSRTLGANPTAMTLIDNKFDQYHLLGADGSLSRATLGEPNPIEIVKAVLDYKSYGTKQILYATPEGAAEGKTRIMMLDGDKVHPIRDVAVSTSYRLDMADYRNSRYLVIAASSERLAYVYRDPLDQLTDPTLELPVAMRALRVPNPTDASFSPNTRFIAVQRGTQFGVYDIFLKRSYLYTINSPMDAPQTKAQWMDADRLGYISAGKQIVFDFDGRNYQTLTNANLPQGSFFAQDYRYMFEFAPSEAGVIQLYRTALRTTADL